MTASPSDPTPHAIAASGERMGADELGLLDVLLVLAENARLLVIGPLMAALVTVGVASLLPPRWESVTLLHGGSPILVTALTSPAMLIPVARAQGIAAGRSAEEAVEELRGRIKVNFNPKDLVLTLAVRADSPQAAQALGTRIFEQIKIASAPTGPEKVRFESQMADINRREEQLDGSIQVLSARLREMPISMASELSRSFGQLISTAHQLNSDRMAIAKHLAGVDESNLLQPPSLPDQPQPRKLPLLALIGALATFCLLLLGVLLVRLLQAVESDPESAGKLRRVREAWWRAFGRAAWVAPASGRSSRGRAHLR